MKKANSNILMLQTLSAFHALREHRLLSFALSGPEGPKAEVKTDVSKEEVKSPETTESVQSDAEKNMQARREGGRKDAGEIVKKMADGMTSKLQELAKQGMGVVQKFLEQWNGKHAKEGFIMTFDGTKAEITQAPKNHEMPERGQAAWKSMGSEIIKNAPGLMPGIKAAIAGLMQGKMDTGGLIQLHNQITRVLAGTFTLEQINAARPKNLEETLKFLQTLIGDSGSSSEAPPSPEGDAEGREADNTVEGTESDNTIEGSDEAKAEQSQEPPQEEGPAPEVSQSPHAGSSNEKTDETPRSEEDGDHEQKSDGEVGKEGEEAEPTQEEIQEYEEAKTAVQTQTQQCENIVKSARTPEDLNALEPVTGEIVRILTERGVDQEAIDAITQCIDVAKELAKAQMQKADDMFRETSERVTMLIQGKKNNIDIGKKEMASLGFVARQTARLSGAWKGMEQSVSADTESLRNAEQAQQDLQRFSTPTMTPKERMEGIRAAMKKTLKTMDYTESNATLKSADEKLTKADETIRKVAEYLPGGSLGTALADARINPSSPDNARNIVGAIALTSLDLIPIPGVARVARGAGVGVRAGLRMAGKNISKSIVKKGAKMAGVAAERYIVKKAKEYTKKGANAVLDTTLGESQKKKPNQPKPGEKESTKEVIAKKGTGAAIDRTKKVIDKGIDAVVKNERANKVLKGATGAAAKAGKEFAEKKIKGSFEEKQAKNEEEKKEEKTA